MSKDMGKVAYTSEDPRHIATNRFRRGMNVSFPTPLGIISLAVAPWKGQNNGLKTLSRNPATSHNILSEPCLRQRATALPVPRLVPNSTLPQESVDLWQVFPGPPETLIEVGHAPQPFMENAQIV